MELHKIINFLVEADRLKSVDRKTSPIQTDRPENSAEHSWQLALMALTLKSYANPSVDINKVVRMLIVHDLAEAYAGDTFLFAAHTQHDQNETELEAARRIYALLPASEQNELYHLWYEFEYGDSEERNFAKAIDRFAPVLMNYHNSGGTWKEYHISYEELLLKLNPIQHGSKELWNLTLSYLDDLLRQGHIQSVSNP